MDDILDTKIWITKDGRKITAKEMTDDHLINLIHFWQKNETLQRFKGHLRTKALVEYLSLPQPQGDMACMAFEQELDSIMNTNMNVSDEDIFKKVIKPSVLWRSLISEADRRGIKYNLVFGKAG